MFKFLFFPSVPYHANTFFPVIKSLIDCESKIIYSDHLKSYDKTNNNKSQIQSLAKKNNIECLPYHPSILKKERPDALIVMCDWGGWPKRMVQDAKTMQIPTVGHVEGPQDYLDTHIEDGYKTKRRKPYSKVDYVFCLGRFDTQFFRNKKTILTGSPRFDDFISLKKNIKTKYDIAINCNFSYGIYSDKAESWINDVVSVAESLKLNYNISQHIGDTTNLSNFNTYDKSIYDLIRGSEILVSRFSTVIIESMLIGKPVIYYNPHQEKQPTFLNSLGSFPSPKTKEDLKSSILEIKNNPAKWKEKFKFFLSEHVSNYKGDSSKVFAEELKKIAKLKSKQKNKFLYKSTIRYCVDMFLNKL